MFGLFSKRISIDGKGNEIVAVKGDKKKKVGFCPKNSTIKISGNNNKVIFNYDNAKKLHHAIPKGLTVQINGNNNLVKINMPIKFADVVISESYDNNIFEIQPQRFPVKDAKFIACEDSSVIIGADCELRAGGIYVVASNNYKKHTKVQIGNGCYIAKYTIIRNSNGQTMLDALSGEPLPNQEPKDLIIEDDVWIGSRCTLIRGAYIAKGSIVGACSLVNKRFEKPNSVIAGIPARVIKENITWDKRHYGVFMKDYINSQSV